MSPKDSKTKRRAITREDEDRGERFIAARQKAGLSQQAAGEAIGVTAQAVQGWESGQTAPQAHYFRKIRELYRTSLDHLMIGEVDIEHSDLPRLTPVRVLTYEEALDMGNKPSSSPQAPIEWAAYPVSRKAFALRVRDDSMAPVIPEGVIAFVDPEVTPMSGSIVLAVPEHGSAPTIKEYVIDGSNRYLRPYNQRYDQVRLTDAARILGVVVEFRKMLEPIKR